MTRISPDTRTQDRDVIQEAYGKVPICQDCGIKESTIWIRSVTIMELTAKTTYIGDLFLCNVCAFHLARILLMDIGHSFEK
jgi:hypothetical protein